MFRRRLNWLCINSLFYLGYENLQRIPFLVKNLKIKHRPTGKIIDATWNVTIINDCHCSLLNVMLSCYGFVSAIPIDPSILRKSGDVCLINNKIPIYAHASFGRNFSWESDFPFNPLLSQVACS
ncbi:hypothetical protein D8674_035331 [Pyrus ussuriensis x Pyrus communis]|uniref:Uncharacterized protein n=1 Tax=Pyrus ussuriensis x Pyrus communis TaxID=2448454 RepID=A0A5N5GC25_9ROSA|nr:hypothetical protein D8674_035331 [Pyrus ussuriensis x Pyrus communis]